MQVVDHRRVDIGNVVATRLPGAGLHAVPRDTRGNVNLNRALNASGANAGVTVNAAGKMRLADTLTLTGEIAKRPPADERRCGGDAVGSQRVVPGER